MITDKAKDQIARLSLEPIMDQIKLEAAREVQQRFCRRRCQKVCDSPCRKAQMMGEPLAELAWLAYTRLN